MLVGVDIGGTFTDLVLSEDGQLKIHKLLSTPHNPAESMLAGLDTITPGGLPSLTHVAHGSTVATNAILERKGAKIALITTQGFRDMLYIGRQNRPALYALHPQISPPLIPRERCYDVPERLDFNGNPLTELDVEALNDVLDDIMQQDIDAIAVCFLYSYINPDHEQMVRGRILQRQMLEDWQVALSSDVLPEFREYERASTVALEAYVRPVMNHYISQLEQQLPENCALRIMKSDGGVMGAERIKERAVNTALSGPAAGVIGAFHLAQLAGYDHIITLDMGGTSTDVALCPGEPQMHPESAVDGLPLRVRLLDIETVGAGGGSIAWLDAGGALRVGPHSAGADPGPIIYGRGGEQITVSDANVILGRLDADHFLGGAMSLDVQAAQNALASLGQQIGKSAVEVAQGVIDVANVNIDRAVRRVSIARGHDPRKFTLVAFGGAGPLHACEVAQRLDIPRVLIPNTPGVLCALGLLVADVVVEHSRSIMLIARRSVVARLRALQAEILAAGKADLTREGIPEDQMDFEIFLDMRYQGQAYELTLPFKGDVVTRFHEEHALLYGYDIPDRPVEIVTMRLRAAGKIAKPTIQSEPLVEQEVQPFVEKASPTGGHIKYYQREQLTPGGSFHGEALVFQLDTTIYIPANWRGTVDAYRNLILESNDA